MHGDEVAIVVLAPDLSVIPDKWPEVTSAGNSSFKTLAKLQRPTPRTGTRPSVRESFAVPPGVNSVRAVLIAPAQPMPTAARTRSVWPRPGLIAQRWRKCSGTPLRSGRSSMTLDKRSCFNRWEFRVS